MASRKTTDTTTTDGEDHAFEALLDYLKRNRGFDFTGYKRATLMRRVGKRMQEVGIDDYVAYQDHLEVHPDEFAFLFNTILINVTAFFRDQPAWTYLASTIVPAILESKQSGEQIRVWSAGCSSGEEAYTLVMILAEALGEEEFVRRVKVYATDVDEEALTAARRAVYEPQQMEPLPEELRERYFERQGRRFAFRKDLRRSVIFGRHDLVQDAPISRIDLMVCRNVLMYFNAETQSRILARLHFGLAPNGYLFLGKAEMLLSHADLFSPVDLRNRIFCKAPTLRMREKLALLAETGSTSTRSELEKQDDVLEAALALSPCAQIVVDAAGTLSLANRAAQSLFALTSADCGRPLQNLEISYRPVELRSLIEEAHERGQTVRVADVEKTLPAGESRYFDVEVTPLRDTQRAAIGTSITFLDGSERRQLRDQLEQTREQLEHSNEELQSANEELETTNEELQSTNEELETTNEELQSGNEELETMNEELQSTNEELRSLNDQMQVRTRELRDNKAFLEAILDGIEGGVVVVDRQHRVRSWEQKMRDLWGLNADEAEGQPFFELDIGLPVEMLRPSIEACLAGEADALLEVDALTRRGTSIRCEITCTPLRQEGQITGAIVFVRQLGSDREPQAKGPPRTRATKRRGS